MKRSALIVSIYELCSVNAFYSLCLFSYKCPCCVTSTSWEYCINGILSIHFYSDELVDLNNKILTDVQFNFSMILQNIIMW